MCLLTDNHQELRPVIYMMLNYPWPFLAREAGYFFSQESFGLFGMGKAMMTLQGWIFTGTTLPW